MVLSFEKDLPTALQAIDWRNEHRLFPVHPHHELRTDDVLTVYGNAKWEMVDILNQQYGALLPTKFDLYHWLHQQEHDEVAYFLNEAGSNCLSYSEFRAPLALHLWLGAKGFVIGIEQQGKGFNARQVHQQKRKENEGAAFHFFRRCRSSIFFDDSRNARIVFMRFFLD